MPLIVDETKTGVGITGNYWAYEHWYLDNNPDFVVFGNAAQASGYYSTADYKPVTPNNLATTSREQILNLIKYKQI